MSDALTALRNDLRHPPQQGGLDELLALWQHDDFEILCDRPHDLEDLPDFPLRLRGAFGRALLHRPGPVVGRVDPHQRPPASDVLFGDMGLEGLARPYVIDADIRGKQVVVRLRVFGEAMFWAREARDALVQALYDGVAIRAGSRHKVSIRPREITSFRIAGLEGKNHHGCREVVLILRSPLVIRRGNSVSVSRDGLLGSLKHRAIEMARWQGIAFVDEDHHDQLEAAGFRLDLSDTAPVTFERYSRRQAGRRITAHGITGQIGLRNVGVELLKLLTIGECTHVGSHAGLGLGRYDIACYP